MTVSSQIFERFPASYFGVVTGKGISNNTRSQELENFISQTFTSVHADIKEANEIQSIPEITCWRETYQAFGSKPSKYRSSIEALLRRVQKSDEPFFINPLVDLYNAISIKHKVPCGAEDLDTISGALRLVVAEGSESGRILGEAEDSICEKGEVAYVDEIGFVCRRWNWREAERTKITNVSTNFIFVCEAVRKDFHANIDSAVHEFVSVGQAFLGGKWNVSFISADSS